MSERAIEELRAAMDQIPDELKVAVGARFPDWMRCEGGWLDEEGIPVEPELALTCLADAQQGRCVVPGV